MILKYTIILSSIILLSGCSNTNTNKKITDSNDYDAYLNIDENKTLQMAQTDLTFWTNKLESAPNQFPYHGKIAGCYSQLFSTTGDIEYLIKSEEELLALNRATHNNSAASLRALAINYISQHRFKEALELLNNAEINGEGFTATEMMMFDVHMELGNYMAAKVYLEKIADMSDFNYLIRVAKWSDHNGKLDSAIKYMEKAMRIAESSNNTNLKEWVYTNLADFYGHAGQIQNSYDFYLKALEIDSNNAYAKKGIAWIVYSHEKNPDEALRILKAVSENHKSPDYHLLMAEIAEYIGDDKLYKEELDSYYRIIDNTLYGDMYNKYKILLFAEDPQKMQEAITLANHEVANRPTPQSYDLLAWAHFKSGNLDKALEIVETKVYNYTYEPEALYHVAEIFKAAGKEDELSPLRAELTASVYELGPSLEQRINEI